MPEHEVHLTLGGQRRGADGRLTLTVRIPGTSSDWCPRYFRLVVAECRFDRHGYERAGYEVAGHARSEFQEEDAPLAELDAALEAEAPVEAVITWAEKYLPRAMALIPRERRRGTFARGVARALAEGLVY